MSERENQVKKQKRYTLGTHLGETRHPKTSIDYWRLRIHPRTVKGRPTQFLYVQLKEAGRHSYVCLDTANKAAAAAKARDYWVRMKAIGLPALLAELAPEEKPERVATVGEAINAARKITTTRPVSFSCAVRRMRQLVAEIKQIKRPRNGAHGSELSSWWEKVDGVRLDEITPEAVRAWKARRVAARSADPIQRRSAAVSADSIIRCARSIFSRGNMVAGLGTMIRLPVRMPFAEVSTGTSTRRFSEKVDPAVLFASAKRDLETAQPEVFRAFALCILGGLRRAEADRLTWGQVDLATGSITIERTEYFEPKSEESNRRISIDPAAVEILRRAKADNPDPTFVLKGGRPDPRLRATANYRADVKPWRTWEKLAEWLRGHGVLSQQPIHALRKLAGSLVFAQHGLEQAREFLGHRDISTTSASYLVTTRRVSVSIPSLQDDLLAGSPAKEAVL